MWPAISADPVAAYAAILSSIIALFTGVRAALTWLRSGPRCAMEIINPLEVYRTGRRHIEIIVSNVGSMPIIVREVHISVHDTKRSKALNSACFDHRASWDPSLVSVPHPTKPNTTNPQTQVLQPGSEIHQLLSPFSDYDPQTHWLRGQVYLRNRRSPVTAWAPPVNTSESQAPE